MRQLKFEIPQNFGQCRFNILITPGWHLVFLYFCILFCILFVVVVQVFCVSMPSCLSRRRHTEQELRRNSSRFSAIQIPPVCCADAAGWGFPAPHFIEAFGPEDEEVLKWFNSPRVAKFPPCFRCGLVSECYCANNDMLQEQIANWLSFRKALCILCDLGSLGMMDLDLDGFGISGFVWQGLGRNCELQQGVAPAGGG